MSNLQTTDFRSTLERLVANPDLTDLSMRQLSVVLYIRDESKPICTIRDIASRLNVSKPAITRAADRLTMLGFTERQVDMADRRSVFVRLTSRGRKFAASLPVTA